MDNKNSNIEVVIPEVVKNWTREMNNTNAPSFQRLTYRQHLVDLKCYIDSELAKGKLTLNSK